MVKRFEAWLLKRQLGYLGVRDEHQTAVIHQILVKANLLTYNLLSLFMLISLAWDLGHYRHVTIGTIFLILTQFINGSYTMYYARKTAVNQTEFYDQLAYQAALHQLKKSVLFSSINWAIWMFMWLSVVLPYVQNEPSQVNWFSVEVWCMAGVVFGVLSYLTQKKRLHLLHE